MRATKAQVMRRDLVARQAARSRLAALRRLGLFLGCFELLRTVLIPSARMLTSGDQSFWLSAGWVPFFLIGLVLYVPRPATYRVAASLSVAGVVYYFVGIGVAAQHLGVQLLMEPWVLFDAAIAAGFSFLTLSLLGSPNIRAFFFRLRGARPVWVPLWLSLSFAAALSGAVSEAVHREKFERRRGNDSLSSHVWTETQMTFDKCLLSIQEFMLNGAEARMGHHEA